MHIQLARSFLTIRLLTVIYCSLGLHCFGAWTHVRIRRLSVQLSALKLDHLRAFPIRSIKLLCPHSFHRQVEDCFVDSKTIPLFVSLMQTSHGSKGKKNVGRISFWKTPSTAGTCCCLQCLLNLCFCSSDFSIVSLVPGRVSFHLRIIFWAWSPPISVADICSPLLVYILGKMSLDYSQL